jgi:dynein heavy chain
MLVNIFLASEDIKAQLSEETKLFEALDREFRDMMIDVSSNPLVVESCTTEKNEILKNQSATIKRCEKSLNEYLE